MLPRIVLVLSLLPVSLSLPAVTVSNADSALMSGDYAGAVSILETLVADGDATAMVRLANLYHRGEGVERDIDKAVSLYLGAAELGHPEAQFNLGNMYLLGEGLPQDDLAQAMEEASCCDLMLIIGTSGVVYPAAHIPSLARKAGAVIVEINPEPSPLSAIADLTILGNSGEVLPLLMAPVIKYD